MTTADQLAIVERKLGGEGKAVALADGGMVRGWMKARRMLVIVRDSPLPDGGGDGGDGDAARHGLFVFVSSSFPVSGEADLALESVDEIDDAFGCEVDGGGNGDDSGGVLLNVSRGGKAKMMFEMTPGYHTQNFVSEIYRQTEIGARVRRGGNAFRWAEKYITAAGGGQNGNILVHTNCVSWL